MNGLVLFLFWQLNKTALYTVYLYVSFSFVWWRTDSDVTL